MAIFSVNQNNQFYAITEKVSATPTTEGQIQLCNTADKKQIFFKHFGKGGLTRTDIIDVDKVSYAKLTKKAAMRRYPKKAEVTLSANVNEGNPISGQDYILRIQIDNYLSPGDASVLIKVGAVHAVKGMTAETFYKKMADSLTKSFSREAQPLLTFKAETDKLVITEVTDQPWRLGVLSQEPVNFHVFASTVVEDGDEVIWATLDEKTGLIPVTADTTGTPVGNGKQIADLEYFCMAERGDMFRNMGWPHNIDVKYMVDPTKEYNVLNIHYAFSDDGVQVHKSEKDITIVTAGEDTVMTGLITDLGKLGITVTE